MRLLVVADLHYSLPQYDWVLSVAADFDLVIIAGDHLDLSSIVDARAQIVVIGKYLDRLREKTRLIVCSGNHDLDSRSGDGEKVSRWIRDVPGVATDGQSLTIGDTLFSICAWWDGPVEREAIGAQFQADAAKPKRTWIRVYHAPPSQSPTSWGGTRSYGDVELTKWIDEYRPDIVFAGHVHQAPLRQGRAAWVDRVRRHLGVQRRTPVWRRLRPISWSIPRHGRRCGSRRPETSTSSLDRPLARPVEKLAALPGWLTSADRPPGPAQRANSRACWTVSASSTSPTMPRWSPCPSYWRLTSTR